MESFREDYNNSPNVICQNVIDTITQSDEIANNFKQLHENSGAYINGSLDVFIGTFMAGDQSLFSLYANDPEKITKMKFNDERELFDANINQFSPLLVEVININLAKNTDGKFNSNVCFRQTIDDETTIIVNIPSGEFLEKYSLKFVSKETE